MTAAEHDRHRDDVGAYLLGALPDDEARAYERHLETCHVCRDELEQLRPAVAVLPRSVPPFEPPPSLKASLMETVRAEAAQGAPTRRRLRSRFGQIRPRAAWSMAAAALLIAVVAGFGVAQLVSDDESRPALSATVDQTRVGDASASFTVADGGEQNGGTRDVEDFPQLKAGQTYQAWTASGKRIDAQPTFQVDADGHGSVTLPDDLRAVDAVLVTREPAGGSPAPSELPLMRVDL